MLDNNPFADYYHFLNIMTPDLNTFSKDKLLRRMMINKSGEPTFNFWLANKYRSLNKKPSLSVKKIMGGHYVSEHDATLSFFRYSSNPLDEKNKYSVIPFHRGVVRNLPDSLLKNKIVIVGPNYLLKSADYFWTPFDREGIRASRLNIIANQVDSLIDEKTVYQIPKIVTYILSLLIALSLALTISRVNPARGLLITLLSIFFALLISYLLFVVFGFWLYTAHIILAIFIAYYILVPFRAIAEYQRRFAIQEETKLIKKVESLKRNFISLMSHDLKTPVAKIVGQADILLRVENNPGSEMSRGLKQIIETTRELNHFISSILDLTKIESKDIVIKKVSKDVNTIIEAAIKKLSFEANSKKIKIEQTLGPLYPIQIDVRLIDRVISNLLENAIKYSGDECLINVKTWDDNKWVYIQISDDGVGIKEEDLEHIFDKFYRVKNDANHSIKGTGLGLYLVKYFIDIHGGEISVHSNWGEGTTFLIKLKNI